MQRQMFICRIDYYCISSLYKINITNQIFIKIHRRCQRTHIHIFIDTMNTFQLFMINMERRKAQAVFAIRKSVCAVAGLPRRDALAAQHTAHHFFDRNLPMIRAIWRTGERITKFTHEKSPLFDSLFQIFFICY